MAGTASDPTTTAGSGGATDQAKEKAQQVAGQAQEKAQEAKVQARDKLRSQVDERSNQYGDQIRTQASDLRSVGQQLRQQGKDGPARMADQAAERVERAGNWLAESDADRILDDVEDFARRNPWAVVAGGIALGLAASRFLKASSGERYRTRQRELPYRTEQPRFSRPVDTTTPVPPAGTVPPPAPVTPPAQHPGAGQAGGF